MSIGGLVSLFIFAGIFVLFYLAGRHFLLVTLGLGGGEAPMLHPDAPQVAYRAGEVLREPANPYANRLQSERPAERPAAREVPEDRGQVSSHPDVPPPQTKWCLLDIELPGEMVLVVAGPGAGKNESVLRPTAYEILATRPQSVVLNDPKGEELEKLGRTGILEGTDLWVFSADPDGRTSVINPVPDYSSAAAFFQTVLKRPGVSDPHWQDAGTDLVLAICEATGYEGLLPVYDAARSERRGWTSWPSSTRPSTRRTARAARRSAPASAAPS